MGRRNLIQAYRQAPWRRQMQVIGLFAAAVVFVALVAGVYLNVTARAATLGREIQTMQDLRQEILRHIADLETQLAELTSSATMRQRAQDLGFVPADKENVSYLAVPGYSGRQGAQIAPASGANPASQTSLPPEFTQSLIEWLRDFAQQFIFQTGLSLGDPTP